mgnify:CR=1 FL=1
MLFASGRLFTSTERLDVPKPELPLRAFSRLRRKRGGVLHPMRGWTFPGTRRNRPSEREWNPCRTPMKPPTSSSRASLPRTPPGRRRRTASERIRHVQVAGDAPAFTGIAPYAEAEAQGGAGDGLRLSPVRPRRCGLSGSGRRWRGRWIRSAPCRRIRVPTPPRHRGDGAVPRAGEAPADAQAANV